MIERDRGFRRTMVERDRRRHTDIVNRNTQVAKAKRRTLPQLQRLSLEMHELDRQLDEDIAAIVAGYNSGDDL